MTRRGFLRLFATGFVAGVAYAVAGELDADDDDGG